jgi:hypothetical protein
MDMNEVQQPPTTKRLSAAEYWLANLSEFKLKLVVVIHHVVAFVPLLLMGGAYLSSWRAEALIGRWPRPMLDDPQFAIPDDWLYSLLFQSTCLLFLGSLAALAIFPVLTSALWHRHPRLWTAFLIAIFVAGWALIGLDPGERIEWFMD